MKALAAIVILIILSSCARGQLFPGGYGPELAHKCEMNSYDPDCIQPPPLFKSS